MSLQWATRAGPLRHLRLGAAFSNPTRVIAVQNQLRRVCLAAKPRLASAQVGSLSALISQQSRSLATATETETAKRGRGRPPGSGTKVETAKKKPVKAKKPKAKKPLTEKQKAVKAERKHKDKIKGLKATALVPPKKLTASAWPLAVKQVVAELPSATGTPIEKFEEAISRAKKLTPDEYKKIEDQARENRATNAANYEAWVKSYTPTQIKAANAARRTLSRILKKRFPTLEDDRQVKRPRTAYFFYMLERQNSNDLKHLGGPVLTRTVGEEWSKLTDYEKEPYQKKQVEDRQRYDREHKEVYGEATPESRPKEELGSDLE